MKRIYMMVALVGAMFSAKAQTIDVEAAAFAYDGANFKLGAVTCFDTLAPYRMGNEDSVYGIQALFLNEGDLLIGDKFEVLSSYSHYVQPNDPNYVDSIKYFYVTTYTLNADVFAGDVLMTDGRYEYNDSIGLLMDWAAWQNDSVIYHGIPWSPFVNGQEYGWFISFRGVTGVEDSDASNNRGVARIIWNGEVNSVKDMIAPREKTNLVVYPNPTANVIKFNQNFENKDDVSVIVRDAVGRTVMTKNYGKLVGAQDFTLDVSSLVSGMYTVELSSSYVTGMTKFSKL